MTNFSLTISKLEIAKQYEGLSNVVLACHYTLTAEKNGATQTFDGVLPLKIDTSNFISFANLTEQNVLDWVNAQMNPAFLQNVKNELEQRFNPTDTFQTELVAGPWA
jgi:hypothetical protein